MIHFFGGGFHARQVFSRPVRFLQEVTCVAAHRSDENIIVTGSLDRQVLIWNVAESNKPTHVCRGHSMKICCLQVPPEGHVWGAESVSWVGSKRALGACRLGAERGAEW